MKIKCKNNRKNLIKISENHREIAVKIGKWQIWKSSENDGWSWKIIGKWWKMTDLEIVGKQLENANCWTKSWEKRSLICLRFFPLTSKYFKNV